MEDHPVIKEFKARVAGADADTVSDDEIVNAMLACPADARAEILIRTGAAADSGIPASKEFEGRSETTNLRQIAQRMNLHRKLTDIDKALRRVGR